MTDIETRIRERSYQTPGRARAAIKMGKIKGKARVELETLVDAWESEGTVDAVVGGVPVADDAEPKKPRANGRRHPQTSGSISEPAPLEGSVQNGKLAPIRLLPSGRELAEPIAVNLNARIRARLTPYGVALLYAARHKVAVPEDLMSKQGVWEIELWQFMLVMGEHLAMGDAAVTEGSSIELLTR